MTLRLLVGSSLLLVWLASAGRCQSLGHYHLPSTVPQFCGLGCGAGHHAPMIRPTQCHPPRHERYIRMPGCGACGALPMGCFPTCNTPGCHAQLDQLLGHGDYGDAPQMPVNSVPEEITPTEAPTTEPEDVSPLPSN